MADNVDYTPGAGATIAADDVGGVLYQRVKSTFGADGSATDVAAGAGLPVAPQYVEYTASITGTGVVIGPLDVRGFSSWGFQLIGSTNQAVIEFSNDNTNWVAAAAVNHNASFPGYITTGALQASATSLWTGSVEGRYLRVRCSAYVSSTSTATLELTAARWITPTSVYNYSNSALSVTASAALPVDTEMPAAAALSDSIANPTAPMVGAANMWWDTTWKRASIANPLPVRAVATASAVTSVSASATSVDLLALNAARRGATVFNDSAALLYLKLGTAASTTSYTVQVPAGGYFELPAPTYTGIVAGIWASATGSARVTELT